MSKRVFPSLDGLDNGEAPVLGIVETHALSDLDIRLPNGFVCETEPAEEPGTVADLFDPYD
ncbi:hypothetical protein E0L36_26750 [Streptomyces sp. AJS327]|uniref:hypothetical protein n=1 Tax=Streptomyces sp. AJS327 TaxID=2545265 RepID=UPI0015E0331F|nr:hypothetical protein [Streptomyces sp. AJS327]MBA0054320.1 hypothetical protein [Streptomyces sp. AJS327]